MSLQEIREKFLYFFKKRGHKVVPSSSLLSNDPSVLLTTAGVQQFKSYYTGDLDPDRDFGSRRVVSVQKCFRTTDLDEVGDKTHLTFFEMLGNFSFADYWKEEAIKWAYEFMTKDLKIGTERIFVSIFKGKDFKGKNKLARDDESFRIWSEVIGLDKKRIKEAGMEDNFWGPTGVKGPCGPTTEIYVAPTAAAALRGEGVEVWNIVFNEYFSSNSREELLAGKVNLEKIKKPGIDTGMGLERLGVVVNRVKDVYSFGPLKEIIDLLPKKIPTKNRRIISDHLRGIVFLISDGIFPSNKEAGYILRRLIRRTVILASADNLLAIIGKIVNLYRSSYPALDENKIRSIFLEEKEKFNKTINNGLKELKKIKKINAIEAFKLYESFGLPFEVIKDIAGKKAASLKREDFDIEFAKHQKISRAGLEKKFGGHGLSLGTNNIQAVKLHTVTHLLQQALRDVLGNDVRQMGSDINSERTRFDFSYNRGLTDQEVKSVEAIINKKIKEDLPVKAVELSIKEAEKTGALHFFKEKYSDKVKIYYIGDSLKNAYSKEFCGGPHVSHTGEIGQIKIIKEESVGAGVRRIRAILLGVGN